MPDKEEQIRKLAHQLWLDEGKPEGKAIDHWNRAKRQIDEAKTKKAAASNDSESPLIASPIVPSKLSKSASKRPRRLQK